LQDLISCKKKKINPENTLAIDKGKKRKKYVSNRLSLAHFIKCVLEIVVAVIFKSTFYLKMH
jgi:hypothetical protein